MPLKLNVPCHWDEETLRKLIDLDSTENVMIGGMYGSIPNLFFGSGRNGKNLTKINKEYAKNFIERVQKCNISFNYLINCPIGEEELETNKISYSKNIEAILEELKPDSLVIASKGLMSLVREIDSKIPIHISTIARIKTKNDLEDYLQYSPSLMVVQHDVNRNFSSLKEIYEKGNLEGVETEVMLTESCLRNCPDMIEHYKTAGAGKDDRAFHLKCNSYKLNHPEELLRANFVRPEDMDLYKDMGIERLKISGRSKNPSWLPEVVKAYLDKDYPGNLIRLLGIDSSLKAEDWIFINNKSLEGFIENFPQTGKSDEIRYCKDWILELYKDNGFFVEGTSYEEKNGNLIPTSSLEKINATYGKRKNE